MSEGNLCHNVNSNNHPNTARKLRCKRLWRLSFIFNPTQPNSTPGKMNWSGGIIIVLLVHFIINYVYLPYLLQFAIFGGLGITLFFRNHYGLWNLLFKESLMM